MSEGLARPLVIVLGILAAAACALGFVFLSGDVGWYIILVVLGAAIVAPFALIGILISENRKNGQLVVLCVTGLIAGLACALFFNYEEAGPPRVIIVTILTPILGAFTYWLVAWRILPPKANEPDLLKDI